MLFPTTFIISAYRNTLSLEQNIQRTTLLEEVLEEAGIKWARALGYWQGERERSLVFVGEQYRDAVLHLLDVFEQDAGLEISPKRSAHLLTRYGTSITLPGVFREVPNSFTGDRTECDGRAYAVVA